ncbi:MAG: 1-acyl-sn-glycerol-3-phosphate acyltransferase [Pseudomonadota bacterium]
MYAIYGQLLFLGDWWSGSELRVFAPPEFEAAAGSEHALLVMNHHVEVDFLIGFMFGDRYSILGNCRAFMLRSLGNAPVYGWSFLASNVIFLERNFERDKDNIARGIKELGQFPDPMLLLQFAEGTRLTPEKLAASQEFAKSRNLPVLQHHLTPRTKGFVHAVLNADHERIRYIYDIVLVENTALGATATLSNLLKGRKIVCDMFIRRYPISAAGKTAKEMSTFLVDMYVNKDIVKGNHLETGSFSRGGRDKRVPDFPMHVRPRRSYSLAIVIFVNTVLGIPVIKFWLGLLLSGSVWMTLTAIAVPAVLSVGMNRMMAMSEIRHGTDYGLSDKKKE